MTFVILRMFHIISATLWVGGTALLYLIIVPAVRAAGPAGGVFMQQLARAGRQTSFLQLVSIVATVTGVTMYGIVSGGFDRIWITSGPGIGFTIGGAAAIFAIVAGNIINAPAGVRMSRLLGKIQASGGTPGPEHLPEIQRLQGRLRLGGVISTVLLLIALAMMSVARYLP
jgi:uncharacterized membrane protein